MSAVPPDESNYRTFVDEGAAIERSPFEAAVGQIFFGTASWIEAMQALIDSKPRSTEHPSAQRFAGRPSVDKIIEVVAGVFMNKPHEIRQGASSGHLRGIFGVTSPPRPPTHRPSAPALIYLTWSQPLSSFHSEEF